MQALISILILLLIFGALIAIPVCISNLISLIKKKRHKKWCAQVFEKYPELKVLLSEYLRLHVERADTVQSARILQQKIDEWVEKNKYLPKDHRVDKHIENLKKTISGIT